MYFTPYTKYDGYWESICSLKEGLGPILKCRVVLDSEGNFESIVRDFTTGKMVASKRAKITPIGAKEAAVQLALSFIKSEMIANLKAVWEVINGTDNFVEKDNRP